MTSEPTNSLLPDYRPSTITVAMPADANANGDIFGGWLMSQMDLAGGVHAHHIARGRVATVSVNGMTFHLPVNVGDTLHCYCRTQRIGTTSIAVNIESWVQRRSGDKEGAHERVTEGVYTFVAIDKNGRPRPVPKSDN